MWRRMAALAAAIAGCCGMAMLGVALAGDPTLRFHGYISELGIAGAREARLFTVGLWCVALATTMLAVSVWEVADRAAYALAGISPMAALTGTVPCTEQCPLPPYERPTLQDMFHGAFAISTFLLAVTAMYLLRAAPDRSLARFSTRCAWVGTVAVVGAGLTQLLFGRSLVVGVAERVMVAVLLVWLIGAGFVRAWTLAIRVIPVDDKAGT